MSFYPIPFTAPSVYGLHPDDQETLDALTAQWAARRPRNLERLSYLDLKTRLKDLKAALPAELVERLDPVVGWPVKAVEELANRIRFDGFAGANQNPLGLGELLEANQFQVEFPQAVTSSLSQSVAFLSTTPDPDNGALLQFHSALWATGIWSRRSRTLTSGLIVTDTDKLGRPTRFLLLVPGEIIECVGNSGGWVIEEVTPTGLGDRIPLEQFPFQPSLDRPFGRSRIDRVVMSVTDRSLRTAARLDVHSELFSALKLILLGIDPSAFENGTFSFFVNRVNVIGRGVEEELPKVEKISAESPEPHIAVMRQLASEFSGHTGVPLSSLGISTQNVESAQAKQEAREDIIGHAETQHGIYGAALKRSLATALMIRDGANAPLDELRALQFAWRAPNRPTLAAVADAGAKQVAAVPGLAETTVGMELIGLTPQQIARFQAERATAPPSDLATLASSLTRQVQPDAMSLELR